MRGMLSGLRLGRQPVAGRSQPKSSFAGRVAVGDRFVKANEPHSAVWLVAEIVEPVPGLPHARLVKEGGVHTHERVTVSLASLADRRLYAAYDGPLAAAAE